MAWLFSSLCWLCLAAGEVPADLPRYDIEMRIDPAARKVTAREWATFTNRGGQPIGELLFHVYPRYKVSDGDKLVFSKTLEALRLSPEEAMDLPGRRLQIAGTWIAGQPAAVSFDEQQDTLMSVALPEPLAAGAQVTVEIAFTLYLPDKWGRWGHHKGVTYLLNWYPVFAFPAEGGWERTPFVPWHQPWHQEPGHYTVRVELPANQVVASSGRVLREVPAADGWKRLTIAAGPARDFALVCSDHFKTWERVVAGVTVRVSAFPEHEANALAALDNACEVIPLYQSWFGPCPHDEFEIAASYFGWNGNECSGLVLIDDRVLSMPAAGQRYLDHLVTHETCHQWWWDAVGTDGYAETFMDEGLVNCFTALRLDAKYGRNAPLIVWPRALRWLPTIGREDLRLSGYYGWRARGRDGPVIQDLAQMKDLNNLFSLAYDRGGKVVQMLHNRLGEERFFAFFQRLYRDYQWKTIHYVDLKRALAEFDPDADWPAFLDGWLIEHKDTDWSVRRVKFGSPGPEGGPRPVTIDLRQTGTMVEPTVVMCRTKDGEIRVPIWPDRANYEVGGASVERGDDGVWHVRIEAPARPTQVEVDPDHALLDAVPDNNRWRPEVAWRFTPLVTPIDMSSQFQAFDRPSIIAGPFIDAYARGGLKLGAQRLEKWQLSAWVGTEPALREAIFGGEAAYLHFPWPMASVGFFYEEGLYNFYNDQRHSGGRFFLRHRFLETSSFLVDDQGFAELYYGLGNEFWAGDDGRPVNAYLGAVGARYHFSTLFPYWDPVKGFLVDVTAEYGNTLFGSSFNYARTTAEFGIVRPLLPEGFGWFSASRIALRAYGGYGTPSSEPLFRLGGGRRLRALDLSTNLGSSVWLGTVEWRFPLWRTIDRGVVDHVLTARNLLGTVFYDFGQSYLQGRSYPFAQGVGVGLRLDVALFAFLERANLRIDIAQPIGATTRSRNGGPILWFGLNQVF